MPSVWFLFSYSTGHHQVSLWRRGSQTPSAFILYGQWRGLFGSYREGSYHGESHIAWEAPPHVVAPETDLVMACLKNASSVKRLLGGRANHHPQGHHQVSLWRRGSQAPSAFILYGQWRGLFGSYREGSYHGESHIAWEAPPHVVYKLLERPHVYHLTHMCVRCSSKFKPQFQLTFYVVNPITKQWVVLPPIPLFHIDYRVGFICRYDNHDTLNYRVVYIPPYYAELKEIKVKTFISEMGEWSESVVLCPGDFGRHGVPYKNLLFWWDNRCGRLIWFNPYNRECYRFFERPIKLDPYHSIECHGVYANCLRQCQISKNPLGACHGCLRICQILKNPQMILRLRKLKDYDDNGGGKWCLEHEMQFDEMVLEKYPPLRKYINSEYCSMLVAYHPNDRDVVYLITKFLKSWTHGNNVQQLMVISCNMRRKTLEVIYDNPFTPRIRNRIISYRNLFDVFTFVHLWWPTPISSLP
ncbi:hypothetical protein SO802_011686 [Lithocarpus litseifolius]|uniref:F-box protein At3g26010-like beta-propeller domain-containing protein n=1 Tax=Lithocarpus litseifolius TaxID=425828 RepID=A0AAW2D0R2_9ROSI